MLIFGLCSTSVDWLSELSDESQPKCKKRPPQPSKYKFSFWDYIQLLMISQAILAMEVNQNAKKRPPKSSKNEMLIFGLCSTSDDWLSNLSNKSQPKCKKGPLSHQKINSHFWITFNFWWLSNLSDKSQPKCKKGPLSHQKMKCSFLDYVQLLMIGWAILATEVNQNAKKGPLSHQNINSHFWITFNFWWFGWAIWATKVNQNVKKVP